MTVRTALLQGTKLLDDATVGVARLTAEVLLAHALRRDRAYVFGHPEHELSELEWLHYGRYLHERMQGKPTQYITGRQEFYGRDFRVTPDVLIPRPETEHVVETALRLAPHAARAPGRILDVGCGSGILAVTLCLEAGAAVLATDISRAAITVAAENAQRLQAPVSFVECDLMSAFADRSMELIVSNPPYVPLGDKAGLQREVRDWEPHEALFAGPTGLELYARIVGDAERVLRPGGWLIMELGFTTSGPVAAMFTTRWQGLEMAPDLAGIPRVIAARLAPA
ncbi:MAG TPA: peptide chain release factor N(5)-glutamine methyltransferase [Bryobacteraceae bacterium]|jgi:release factor glutamine methyltransferase|nr:peptide chain release factor N(5)-glutamine methyltransferase [Bryobacteraceae bacterium]